jgi:hypothetical protein
MAINLGILDCSCHFQFKWLLTYPHEAEWTPFQTHYFSENLVVLGIKTGTSGSVARNSDHKTTEASGPYRISFFFPSPEDGKRSNFIKDVSFPKFRIQVRN